MTQPRAVTREDFPETDGHWRAGVETRLKKLFTMVASSPVKEVAQGSSFAVRGLLDLVGSMEMRSAVGDLLIRMGSMPLGDRGLQFFRENGTKLFEMRKVTQPTNPQTWTFFDNGGHAIVAEQDLFGGLAKPMLEHPFQPVATAPGTPVTCGPYGFERTHPGTEAINTWKTLFVHDGKRQNTYLDLKVAVICSDATTAGEIRVVDEVSGDQLGGFLIDPWIGVIPAGTTTLTVLDPIGNQVLLTAVDVHAVMRLGLQVRRTAGSGSITLSVAQAIGG